MKILLYDIETSPNLAYIWDKYEQNALGFEKERELLCFAYKWLGDKKISSCSKMELGEKELVQKLHTLINEADIIVGQNSDSFDNKMANAFFIKQGLPPPKPYKTIDTLKIARSRFRFNSNHLNDLGEYLGLGGKKQTGGFGLWLGCLKGDKKSWKLMVEYNKRDVELLEKVYLKLVPWANNTPPVELGMTCPACGSLNLQRRGFQINKVFMSQRLQCTSCGKWCVSSNKIKHNSLTYAK
ncbi:ribonuclease H-like domain-containing protein [Candidatus Dojkabacteria bacterium]|jgi:hypothetical protein|nr:ribonuclease H-like domain-containing protein [Candidatus Dojkabacteria bacterium]